MVIMVIFGISCMVAHKFSVKPIDVTIAEWSQCSRLMMKLLEESACAHMKPTEFPVHETASLWRAPDPERQETRRARLFVPRWGLCDTTECSETTRYACSSHDELMFLDMRLWQKLHALHCTKLWCYWEKALLSATGVVYVYRWTASSLFSWIHSSNMSLSSITAAEWLSLKNPLSMVAMATGGDMRSCRLALNLAARWCWLNGVLSQWCMDLFSNPCGETSRCLHTKHFLLVKKEVVRRWKA